jgi:16S rRNA (adenine1518-N6/adenine1519-N6)-dimethyltransferase
MLYKLSDLIIFLKENNIYAKKSLSQNFLVDKNIVDKFINSLNLTKEDTVLEIGPGPGVLTYELLKKAKNVIAIEKDTFFYENLKNQNISNLTIYNEDVLKFDFSKIKDCQQIKVIGSLPYSITTPIIEKLLNQNTFISKISIMIQKEVALRIISKKDKKTYSSFSIFVNYHSIPSLIHTVSKNCFYPSPKVDSAILLLDIKNLDEKMPDEFFKFVQKAFNQRRKKLVTSLKNLIEKDSLIKTLKDLNLDINARAENLSINDYISIYKILSNSFKIDLLKI